MSGTKSRKASLNKLYTLPLKVKDIFRKISRQFDVNIKKAAGNIFHDYFQCDWPTIQSPIFD